MYRVFYFFTKKKNDRKNIEEDNIDFYFYYSLGKDAYFYLRS